MAFQMVAWPMTSRDPQRCCEAVRSAILSTAWLLVLLKYSNFGSETMPKRHRYNDAINRKYFFHVPGNLHLLTYLLTAQMQTMRNTSQQTLMLRRSLYSVARQQYNHEDQDSATFWQQLIAQHRPGYLLIRLRQPISRPSIVLILRDYTRSVHR